MRKIFRVKIDDLFGYVNHDIEFTKDFPITILSGPNGTGKTHFLKLLDAAIKLDLRTLSSIEYKRIEIYFTDKWILRVEPKGFGVRCSGFKLSGRKSPSRRFLQHDITYSADADESAAPEWAVQLPDGNWFDTRLDRVVPRRQVERWNFSQFAASLVEGTWAEELFQDTVSIFVDTQRLDNVPAHINRTHGTLANPRQTTTLKRIRLYMEQVTAQLSDARRSSLDESLSADQTFAARVLKTARTARINEKDLKERYKRIAATHSELHSSGLGVAPVDVRFPEEKTTPTERRILNVFLDDWERKLQPLLPVHQKVQSLRRIIDSKFIGKEMNLSNTGRIRFRSKVDRRPLGVNALSSGEQHLLAVFTMLLFSARKGSLVLIDEPEISMHAAWKHSFLSDIEEVASLSGLQIVLATHSSAIINGNWNLVQETSVPEIVSSADETDENDDDLEVEV